MINILHVYKTYFPDSNGGLEQAIRQICLSTSSYGVKSKIFTLSTNPLPFEIDFPEGKVMRCKSWISPASCNIGSMNAFSSFAKLANEVDIVHYHFPWPFADLLHHISGCKTPAVMTYHSDIVRQKSLKILYEPLMRKTLKSMDAIVVTSSNYANSSPVVSNSLYSDRLHIIPLGIVEKSYPSNVDEVVLFKLGLSKTQPFFLFVGFLRYYKGLNYLIEAAAHLNAKVVIAGGGDATNLKNQVNSLDIDNVIFAGQISDEEKIALIKNCKAFVLPSHLRSEAFGMVLVEASMFGKPMVSCNLDSGTSFINIDNETGFVVPPRDSNALFVAMNNLLKDPRLAKKFGNAARVRYENLFSDIALGTAYSKLYKNILKEKNRVIYF